MTIPMQKLCAGPSRRSELRHLARFAGRLRVLVHSACGGPTGPTAEEQKDALLRDLHKLRRIWERGES